MSSTRRILPSTGPWSTMRLGVWLSAILFLGVSSCIAKKVSGSFKLTGEHSEHVLTSFAVVPTGARLSVNLSTGKQMYEEEQYLRFHLFQDTDWPKFQKALTCEDRVRFTLQQQRITFDYIDDKWKATELQAEIDIAKYNPAKAAQQRPHYWYLVVTDCSLETGFQRDQRIPQMHYEVDIVNLLDKSHQKTSHLSADEMNLTSLHMFTFLLSGLMALYLLGRIAQQVFSTSNNNTSAPTIHAAVLWVLLAAALDAASSLLEMIHLRVYHNNGIGVYFIDALSAHCEALCDALLVLLLLTIGAGWTLPSDVVIVNANESKIQQWVTECLAKPFAGSKSSSSSSASAGLILAVGVVAGHVILAQWGRTYNDDFESYHDLEHLPGQVLMVFRILCGFLVIVATVNTRLKCKSKQLQSFYVLLGMTGCAWCWALPLLSWSCSLFVPYYLRHPAVLMGAALAQSSSLVVFAWLVTSHSSSAYHQFSHMAANTSANNSNSHNGASLLSAPSLDTDEEPRTWKWGKAKVRLD